jgi:CHAT domain
MGWVPARTRGDRMAAMRAYVDLTLRLRQLDLAADTFQVELAPGAPGGDTGTAVVSYQLAALQDDLETLDAKEIDRDGLIRLGRGLAERLLPAAIREPFERLLATAGQDGGVRLRLAIDAPPLATLPWEYCYYEPSQGGPSYFLLHNPQISLVRHEALPTAPPSLVGHDPQRLRMVAAFASPPDYDPLRLDKEEDMIGQALGDFEVEGVAIEWKPLLNNATQETLARALLKPTDLFHFAGHGEFGDDPGSPPSGDASEGRIVLASTDPTAPGKALAADDLAPILQQAGIRLAYLGACDTGRRDGVSPWTGIAPVLASRGIPAIVAMQYAVFDHRAIAFNQMFYTALASGLSIDEAVSAGRLAMVRAQGEGDTDWGVPVLYMRAPDGVLFPELAAQETGTAQALRQRIRQAVERNASGGQVVGVRLTRGALGQGVSFDVEQVVTVNEGELIGLIVNGDGTPRAAGRPTLTPAAATPKPPATTPGPPVAPSQLQAAPPPEAIPPGPAAAGSDAADPRLTFDQVYVPPKVLDGARHFAGREWALDQVIDWMDHGTERFLSVIGEPGCGKSAFAAWMAGRGSTPADPRLLTKFELVRSAWKAVHFCDISAGSTLDGEEFAKSIGRQLSARILDFAPTALQQNNPELGSVQQVVTQNTGTIIGYQFQQLVVNGRDLEDAYNKGIRQPLRAVAENHQDVLPVFILVDGLDEVLGRPPPNIVTLLAASGDLPEGVRFVVVSRRQPEVTKMWTERRTLDLSDEDFNEQNNRDIREYVRALLNEDPIRAKVPPTDDEALMNGLVSFANGNFLVAEFIMGEIARGTRAPSDIAAAPSGLFPLYRRFLDRLMPQSEPPDDRPLWRQTYRPLLGSLSVANPAAPKKVLPNWLKWDPDDLGPAIARVWQLTDEVRDVEGIEDGYRVYHRTLSEFLAASEIDDQGQLEPNPYVASPVSFHKEIATYYLDRVRQSGRADWTRADTYCLRRLVTHLRSWLDLTDDPAEQADVAARLYEVVLDDAFTAAQQEELGGPDQTVFAFSLALEAAQRRGDQGPLSKMRSVLVASPYEQLRTLARVSLQRQSEQNPTRTVSTLLRMLPK